MYKFVNRFSKVEWQWKVNYLMDSSLGMPTASLMLEPYVSAFMLSVLENMKVCEP